MENLKDYGTPSLVRLLEVARVKFDEIGADLVSKRAEIEALEAELTSRAPPPPPEELTLAIGAGREKALKAG